MRQPVRPRVEVRIRELGPAVGEGCGVRGADSPGLEEAGQRRPGVSGRSVVPLRQHLPALSRVEHIHFVEPDIRPGAQRFQYAHQPAADPLHGRPVEQVRRPGQLAAHPGGAALSIEDLAHHQVEIELRIRRPVGCAPRHAPDLRTGQVEGRPGVVLHGQHDLEQRVPGQRTRGSQLLHQPLERHVLMREGGQARLVHPLKDPPEGGVPGEVGAYHEGVDEEADQIVQRLVGTPRHRDPDGNVAARSQAGQQDRQTGLQHDERRHVVRPCQFQEPPVHVGGQLQGHTVPAMARDRGVGAVDGEFQLLRCAGQRLTPVGDLA
ncbi:hypothetical protein GCM10022403_005890 [Streptomyces coacervatus]|uniref:Uncharacterized protein n=1 Tax=Streptomyces coacervatus TaxID=647381 RepID=A0ABP7GR10_9ACTN